MAKLLLTLFLLVAPMSAAAGTLAASIGGASFVTVLEGDVVPVDLFITFGPTTVGGLGAVWEVSFDSEGGTVLPGARFAPTDWILLGSQCSGGSTATHCENAAATGDPFGTGQAFASGSVFHAAFVLVDTTGLMPGLYDVEFNLNGPGDTIITASTVVVSSEYTTVGATIFVAPEPGTAALLGLGLALLGIGKRGHRSDPNANSDGSSETPASLRP